MNEDLIMNEEEAKEALFKINYEYMSHPPKERALLYEEYKSNRNKVKEALIKYKEMNVKFR